MRLIPFLAIPILKNTRMNTRLFSSVTNFEKPACLTCKFYKPENWASFDSTSSKCSIYGNKNLHTGEIEYYYATACRNNETLCGQEGKLYEENELLNISKLGHHFFKYGIIYQTCMLYLSVLYFIGAK
jgi:hypothetical protein